MIDPNQSEHETSWPPPIQANLPPGPKPRRRLSVGGADNVNRHLGTGLLGHLGGDLR